MNSGNTIIIGVLAESPYAEYMGDINNNFCKGNATVGCLYNAHANEYLPYE